MHKKKVPQFSFDYSGVTINFYNGIFTCNSSVFEPGSAHGEIALSTPGSKRTATILCRSAFVDLAVLDWRNFDRALKNIEDRFKTKLAQFMIKTPIFAQMERRKLENVADRMTKMKFNRKAVIYLQKDEIVHIYLIGKGEFELTRVLKGRGNNAKESNGVESMIFHRNQPKHVLAQ